MAPELRKRKSAAEPVKAAPSKTTKPASKRKRKATEEALPASAKKQKPVKAIAAPKSTTPSKAAKANGADLKTNGKKKAAEPVAKDLSDDADTRDEEKEEDENDDALILATEIDGSDGEADDDETLFKEGEDVGVVPSVSKAVRESAEAAAEGGREETGVIYVGRIPHGFYENEMRQYFSQFGPITRLRLSRNKKTGASKHFAFVEFAQQSTAEVVALTMNNYLLFGHILKCQLVPKERIHEELFKGANRRFKKVPWNKLAGKKLEEPLSESAWQVKVNRVTAKRAAKAKKLKDLGYDFEGPELKAVPAPSAPATSEEQKNSKTGKTKLIEPASAEEVKMDKPVPKESEVEEEEDEPKVEQPEAKKSKAKAAKKGSKTKKGKVSK